MRYLLLPFTPRYILFTIALLGTFTLAAIGLRDPDTLPALALPLTGRLRRSSPARHLRPGPDPSRHPAQLSDPAISASSSNIRPEIRQYFFEAEKEAAVLAQPAHPRLSARQEQLDKRPFGTQFDVYRDHYDGSPFDPAGSRRRSPSASPSAAPSAPSRIPPRCSTSRP